jgi:Fusaric acid resistance protein-like/Aromatic acid exporter family member 2
LQLRQATLIIPQTGRRVKRQVTLHEVDGQNDQTSSPEESSNDTTPLLRRRTNSTTAKRRRGTTSVWQAAKSTARDKVAQVKNFLMSDIGKGVFKCSVAYFLGSLATFVPFLRHFLGQQDGKHMVATITVYFHPARSLGSMFDALICAAAAFLYAAFISITSMSVSAFFSDTLDLMPVGHVIVLIVFCGGGLGFIGWVKQIKGDPLVNVACSLASLAIITVITKEGAVQAGNFSFAKISQVLKMIVMGVLAAMVVSLVVFPVSGRENLRNNITTVTDSLADILALITKSFLSGFEEELEEKPFKNVTERHLKTYSTLVKNLKEAKYEHCVVGTERQFWIEARLVLCVQRVAQSIGGLRSAAAMQFAVSKQTVPPLEDSHNKPHHLFSTPSSAFASPLTPPVRPNSGEFIGLLSAIDELSDEDNAGDEHLNGQISSQTLSLRSPSEIFALFIQHLGPSMKSLAFTLKEILDERPFDRGSKHEVVVNSKLSSSLLRAIDLYTEARQEALKAVYDQKDLHRNRPIELEADWEEVAASCGHFSFSLLEVAEQVKEYLSILDELQLEVEERPAGRTWSWLKFWKAKTSSKSDIKDREAEQMIDEPDVSAMPVRTPMEPRVSPSHMSLLDKLPLKQQVFRRMWDAMAIFRRDDTKFAIKVGVGAALYAMFSFIVATRPFYAQWRGEWGLLSYMLVCSMTIGASNTTGYSRFLGTCLGAVCAIAAWDISHANPYVLAFLGWCMSFWTSYIIVGQGKGPMGRFIMLTYNLSALYAYSLSVKDEEGDDDEGGIHPIISEIAGHRVVAVLSGCIWGLIITRVVWPISARNKLKDGLSLLWLRMGLIWKRDPLMTLTDGETSIQYMNLREEFELQRFLSTLEKLQASAKSEFELKGPFPEKQYARILKSTSRILDAFHAMNIVILKDLNPSKGEAALLKATARERAQLCSRISHLFSGVFTCPGILRWSNLVAC